MRATRNPLCFGSVAILSMLICSPVVLHAQVTLPRLSSEITLDGVVDEAAWEEIDPLPMTMYQPTFGGTPTEKSEIRVAYDSQYIYVSGRLYDSDTNGIRANTLYRDRYSGDDTFAIVLDTFNDDENAVWFFTTPAGVRFDTAVSNDGDFSGGRAMNSSWNTFWDVETSVMSDGWSAEMRIPFSSLGFQSIDGAVTMGLITYRYIARKAERHIYPAIPPNWGLGFAKPSVAQDIRLEGVVGRRPVYISPYALGGVNTSNELNEAETAYERNRDVTREVGLDLKYNITNNLSLDLTANTDFAQVEADDQQVNLSRFSLFFPEKRQFFQQRAGVFNFSTGGSSRLFHSRRIGLSDGKPVRLLGGTRIVGRVGSWDVGVIDMQTGSSSERSSENFGVFRIRRNVLNSNSYAGAMVTSRLNGKGEYNVAYGFDSVLRVRNQDFATVQLSQVFDDEFVDDDVQGFSHSSLIRLAYERRTQQKLFYSTSLTRAGENYDPGIGFRSRNGYVSPRLSVGYGWFGDENSFFRSITTGAGSNAYFRLDGGEGLGSKVESAEVEAGIQIELKSGTEGGIEVGYSYEDLTDTLSFSPEAEVLPGEYSFVGASAQYEMHDGNLFRSDLRVEGGSFYDGQQYSVSLSPTWSASRHVEMGADLIATFIRFPDRDQKFNFQIIRGRTRLAMNRKISADVFVQLNTASKFVSANARFRYNLSEGNDLWIVYDEGTNFDRMREVPFLPPTRSRTILVKFTYTFVS